MCPLWEEAGQGAARCRRPDLGRHSRPGHRGVDLTTAGGIDRASRGTRRTAHAGGGSGGPPCPYAVAVLGSAGREESLLAMDQDNAWSSPKASRTASRIGGLPRLRRISQKFWMRSECLTARAGSWPRLRSGGAQSPRGVGASTTGFDAWTRAICCRSTSSSIYARSTARPGLANHVWRYAFEAARGDAAFAKVLAESAGPRAPGFDWLGRIKTDKGRIDLKKAGLFGIVSTARTLAIRHHVVERSTQARLAGIKGLGRGGEADLDALCDAQEIFLDLILRQQIVDIADGRPANNRVAVERLSRRDRSRLRVALNAVGHLDELMRDLLP